MLPVYITKILEKIAKNEGLSDYAIELNPGSNHGDNFLGELIAISLSGTKFENGLAQKCEMKLLCKRPPTNKTRLEHFKSNIVFDREIYIYSKLLPAFVRFQQEKGLSEEDSFSSFPKVYSCEANQEDGTYILIMEDLRPKKFTMLPKNEVIPFDHLTYVLRNLAKFHAISFAMKDQRPNEFKEFEQLKDTFGEFLIHGKIKLFLDESCSRAADVLTNPEHKKLMQNFCNTFVDAHDNCVFDKEFAVITHGDLWCNNLLFRYDDLNTNKVTSLRFIDWQNSRYCPLALDLLYLIFIATDKEYRDQHYETLLKVYYSQLSETIQKLGSDPTKLYTYENLKSQLCKFGEFALLFAPAMTLLSVAGSKDINSVDDWSEKLDNGEISNSLLNAFDEKTNIIYSARMNGLVTDLLSYGYIGNK